METQSTHRRLIPCEKHAAIIGRQAARLTQQATAGNAVDSLFLQAELDQLLGAISRGEMGLCSHDFCVIGDDSEEQS